jgi:hypothetical protein
MADEQKPKEKKERKKASAPADEESILTTTAKAIGKAAGKIAVAAGVEPDAPKPHTVSVKVPKLQKKNKSRLPRRQKKAQQKAAAAQLAR